MLTRLGGACAQNLHREVKAETGKYVDLPHFFDAWSEFSHTDKQIYGQRSVKERVNKPVDSVHIEDCGHAGREGVASKARPVGQHAVVEGETILQGRRTIDGLRLQDVDGLLQLTWKVIEVFPGVLKEHG